jgi:hypothetical protein
MNIVVSIVLVAFLVWVALSLRRMLRSPERAKAKGEVWRDLARRHGFEVETAEGPAAVREVTWETFRFAFSRRLYRAVPSKGELVLRGSREGFPLRLDVVAVRTVWTDRLDDFTRCTVEVPGLPPGLRILPRGRLGRLLMRASTGDDGFERAFHRSASSPAAERFLDPARRAALLRAAQDFDALEVAEGKVHTVTRGEVTDPATLDLQIARTVQLARALR